ncbi:MAG: ABC transporter permease [Fuerstiella sp.]
MSASNHRGPTVYRPGSPLRQPSVLFRELGRDLLACRELAWRLLVRNIAARYRQTMLGYFWAIFPPLATTAIWLFLTSEQVVSINVGSVPYPVFLVTGTILWQTFVDAIQIPVRVISESKSMLAKINFPREALPLTAFAECWFNVGIRSIILAVAWLYLGFVPAATLPLALVGLLSMILLGLMIGILLSPFALLYQDVSNGLVLICQVWMYCSPVIYLPKTSGWIGRLNQLNPVSPLLCQTRDWLLTGQHTWLQPSAVVFGTTVVGMFLAFVVYRIGLPRAIERISS